MLSRRILLGSIAAPAVVLAVVSLAWACVPQGAFNVNPNKGPAGSQVAASGSNFPAGNTIEIRWGSRTGPILATATGPAFSNVPITIPASAPQGIHFISASGTGEHADHSATDVSFEVTAQSTPPPGPPGGQQPPPGGQPPPPGGQPPGPGGQQPTPPVTPPNGSSRRARAIARCNRKYSARRARTPAKRRRLSKQRKACLRKAKKLSAAQGSTLKSALPPLLV